MNPEDRFWLGRQKVIADAISDQHWPYDDTFGECPCGWSSRTGDYITDHLAQVALDALEEADYEVVPTMNQEG